MQERLTEIEIKIAHMEQSLGELSDVLYQQQSLIDRLELRFNELRQRMAATAEAPENTDPSDEKPPHY
jgi:SlyX protein